MLSCCTKSGSLSQRDWARNTTVLRRRVTRSATRWPALGGALTRTRGDSEHSERLITTANQHAALCLAAALTVMGQGCIELTRQLSSLYCL